MSGRECHGSMRGDDRCGETEKREGIAMRALQARTKGRAACIVSASMHERSSSKCSLLSAAARSAAAAAAAAAAPAAASAAAPPPSAASASASASVVTRALERGASSAPSRAESFLCCVICSRRTCADADADAMCKRCGAHAVRIGAGLLVPPRQG